MQDGVPFPPSLQNIFKEIQNDLGTDIPTSGNLTRWAEQGVLLLNATLTVQAHQANSHAAFGWREFTDAAIRALATKREGLVYMLWGSYARGKAFMIDRKKNLVLESVHPSPLSANRADGSVSISFRAATSILNNKAKHLSSGNHEQPNTSHLASGQCAALARHTDRALLLRLREM